MNEAATKADSAIIPWLIHALTASGAVLGFLALLAIEEARWWDALGWLLVALLVDGVDGPLARWANVKGRIPRIDGALLDLVVDYLTYVFLPTLLICRAGLVPEELKVLLAALILMSSLYHYARSDLKTADNFFVGFPALWNVVAFGLFVVRPGPGVGAGIICIAAALTFAPVYFVHPMRVRAYRPWLPATALLWTASALVLFMPGLGEAGTGAAVAIWLACTCGLVFFGLLRTLRRVAHVEIETL